MEHRSSSSSSIDREDAIEADEVFGSSCSACPAAVEVKDKKTRKEERDAKIEARIREQVRQEVGEVVTF